MKLALLALAALLPQLALANSVDDAFRNAERNQARKEEKKREDSRVRAEELRKQQKKKAAEKIVAQLGTSVAEFGSFGHTRDFVQPSAETLKLKTKSGLVCQVEFMEFRDDSESSLRYHINEMMPALESLCARKSARDMAKLRDVINGGSFFNSNYEQDLDRAYSSVKFGCELNQWEVRGDCYNSAGKQSYMNLNHVFANDLAVKVFNQR